MKFLAYVHIYAVIFLFILFLLTKFIWLPEGTTLAGHDSGLPLDTKQFLLTRLYAWDDRIGVGLDNSANFGSLTIHFFDYLSSVVAGVPYGGSFVSLFFWLGVIFLSALFLAFQLKDTLGRHFVFILPIFTVFNFYIFQSVFMLERAKFGVFSATLITLGVFFMMQQKKISLVTAAIISAISFSIFNGGGWFGITLYAGVAVIVMVLLATSLFSDFKRTIFFVLTTFVLYLLLNAYSILPYAQNFLSNDVPRLLQESSSEGHKSWLHYVSRSTSFINLFRLSGIPDWYGEPNEFGKVNPSHPYASIYLNNNFLVFINGVFPLLAFASLLLAKTREQGRILSFFGVIALVELIFTAGSHSPFGPIYELLMTSVPGFFLLRSAFYKFSIFYLLGILVMISFTIGFFIEKISSFLDQRLYHFLPGFKKTMIPLFTIFVIGLWLSYHWVLFSPEKIFSWKEDQSTRMQVPHYIFDFADWVEENNSNERILMVPPVNHDWLNDAYSWGYWSLSPLPYVLTTARVLSNWHGLVGDESDLVNDLYNFIKIKDEKNFIRLASTLDIGYLLVREDVLIDSDWSSAEKPESYKLSIESFDHVRKVAVFGDWTIYKLEQTVPGQIYAVTSINSISDNFISLINKFFIGGHTVGFSTRKKFPEIDNVSANKAYAFDCLSCLLERDNVINIPRTVIKPGSILYYFKEMREQSILNTTNDLRSKIANYLGFILNRDVELRQMVDSNVSERILLESIGVIRSYLGQLYFEIGTSEKNFYDFKLLRQVIDYLNPVEREISNYMRGSSSKTRGNRFGEEMLGILWDINKIKGLFNPLLESPERWSNEKVYSISFAQSGDHSLIFSSQAFPHTLDNDVILPKITKFIKDGEERILNIKNDKGKWLIAELGFQTEGDGELRLYFEELPNLFEIKNSGFEHFFFGKVACYNGPIKNFDKGRAYQVMISKSERLRKIQVIFKDKNKIYTDRHGFLKGEDLFEIDTIPQGQFAKYVYFPAPYSKDIHMYICSDDTVLPPVEKVIVREFIIPSVVSIKKSDVKNQTLPDIEYKKIDPTQYKVKIKDAKQPFVLLFNEKYNSGWYLFKDDGNKLNLIDKHFIVDGYANGWLIEGGQVGSFLIKYTPQRMFYIGSIISIIALLVSILWLIYIKVRVSKQK